MQEIELYFNYKIKWKKKLPKNNNIMDKLSVNYKVSYKVLDIVRNKFWWRNRNS
jgi:hypothetical protein